VESSSSSESCRCLAARAAYHGPACAETPLGGSGSASPELSLQETHDAGCPCRRHDAEAPRRKARTATSPPVPSPGFLPLSTVLAAVTSPAHPSRGQPLSVSPRRFAAFFHAARAPGPALQSSCLPGSRARSRGPLLPCGFAVDRGRRGVREVARSLSPPGRPLAAAHPRRGQPDDRAKTTDPRDRWSSPSCALARVDRDHPARPRRARR